MVMQRSGAERKRTLRLQGRSRASTAVVCWTRGDQRPGRRAAGTAAAADAGAADRRRREEGVRALWP